MQEMFQNISLLYTAGELVYLVIVGSINILTVPTAIYIVSPSKSLWIKASAKCKCECNWIDCVCQKGLYVPFQNS